MAVFFYAICSVLEVCFWIYLFVLRFSHAGQVCSGDMLNRKNNSAHYVRIQGLFIKVVAILVVSACLCIVCLVPYLKRAGYSKKMREKQQQNAQKELTMRA